MPPAPHDIVNASAEIASTESRSVTIFFRRPATGIPARTAPNANNPPVHGSLGAWLAAELDAVIVKLLVLLPLAESVAVPLDGLTVISDELVVAVQATLPANVVDASTTVTACDPPLLSGTVVSDDVTV